MGTNIPFFFNMETGVNHWEVPPCGSFRLATPLEQTEYATRMAKVNAQDVAKLVAPNAQPNWVMKSYGIHKGPYWYSSSTGQVQLSSPFDTPGGVRQ